MKPTQNILYHPIVGNFLSWFLAVTIMSFYVNGYTDNTGVMIIGLFVGSFWTVYLHAYREYVRIDQYEEHVDHLERFLYRFIIACAISFLTHWLAFGFESGIKAPFAFGVLYLGSIFWLLFDLMLNYHREKPLLYISGYYRTSKVDKFFSRFNPNTRCILWLGSKILLFLVSMALYNWSLK